MTTSTIPAFATAMQADVARDPHYNFAYLDESTKRMLRLRS